MRRNLHSLLDLEIGDPGQEDESEVNTYPLETRRTRLTAQTWTLQLRLAKRTGGLMAFRGSLKMSQVSFMSRLHAYSLDRRSAVPNHN